MSNERFTVYESQNKMQGRRNVMTQKGEQVWIILFSTIGHYSRAFHPCDQLVAVEDHYCFLPTATTSTKKGKKKQEAPVFLIGWQLRFPFEIKFG